MTEAQKEQETYNQALDALQKAEEDFSDAMAALWRAENAAAKAIAKFKEALEAFQRFKKENSKETHNG